MKRIVFFFLFVSVFFLACSKNGKNDQQLEKKPILVKVETAKTGTLSISLNYKGTVTAWKTANITPEVAGRIGRIYKKQGDKVKRGDLLAELDATALTLQFKQAQAAAAVTESAYKDALLTHDRMKTMLEKRAISQIQYEKAQLGLDAADTQMKSAKANLDLVMYSMKKSAMRSPFDGVVAAKVLEEGDMINPMMGMGACVMIVMDLSKVKVLIDVAAEDVERVAIDQPCKVHVSSREENFTGKVYSKNLAADPMSKTFKTEVVIDNPQMKIKPGVYADISIEVIRKDNILLLPLSALLGNRQVVLYKGGKALKREVRIGLRNHKNFEILSGVTEGDIVVTEGGYDLKDGALISTETDLGGNRNPAGQGGKK